MTCSGFTEKYRICKECRKVQSFLCDSQGGFWNTLPECEQKIVQDKIKINEFIERL